MSHAPPVLKVESTSHGLSIVDAPEKFNLSGAFLGALQAMPCASVLPTVLIDGVVVRVYRPQAEVIRKDDVQYFVVRDIEQTVVYALDGPHEVAVGRPFYKATRVA